MSAAHTPGPWTEGAWRGTVHSEATGQTFEGPHAAVFCDGGMAAITGPIDQGTSVADARLIAAAPELLEALEEAHRALMHYEWYANPASGWAAPDKKFVRHMTDAAIAKARGDA